MFHLGIHNEPGVTREKIQPFERIIEGVMAMVLKTRNGGWEPSATQEVALMVNNLGGLSVLEMGVITEEVLRQLAGHGIRVARVMSGPFLTSLDGPGFSITLLGLDGELSTLLDAPTSASDWPKETGLVDNALVASQMVETPSTEKPESLGASKISSRLPLHHISQKVTNLDNSKRSPAETNYRFDRKADQGG
jgi:triose/dihydroxyacetone kinase / FAD-AMP lyase (cyclizing)